MDLRSFGKVMGIPDERCFPDVRPERSSLANCRWSRSTACVGDPEPAADGSTDFDIDRGWAAGPELASFEFASWAFYDKRVIPETMNWKISLIPSMKLSVGFLHRNSLREVLHGNVTDFRGFRPQSPPDVSAQKLQRLKAEPEDSWDLMWNTSLVYSLFPNTLLLVQATMSSCAYLSVRGARRSCRDGAWTLRAAGAEHGRRAHPLGQEHAAHPRRGDGRGFPDRTQYPDRLTSGAQTDMVYGRNEPR